MAKKKAPPKAADVRAQAQARLKALDPPTRPSLGSRGTAILLWIALIALIAEATPVGAQVMPPQWQTNGTTVTPVRAVNVISATYAGGTFTIPGSVPTTRTIATTAPLTCDGGASCDLAANRTLAINAGGAANRVLATTDGAAITATQVVAAMVAPGTYGINISGNAVTVTNGVYTTTLAAGDIAGTFGMAFTVGGLQGRLLSNAAPSDGSLIRWDAAPPGMWWPSTATYPDTVTQGDILIATGADAVGVLADGTAGQVIRAGGAGDPAWSTATYPNTVAQGDLLVASGANVVGVVSAGAAKTVLTGVGAALAPIYSGNPAISHLFVNGATALADTNFALSAAWGLTATVSGTVGYDAAWQTTVTANGAGIAANPTLTLTFANGYSWTTAPQALCKLAAASNSVDLFEPITETTTPTTVVVTFNSTPTATNTYTFRCHVLGI